MLRTNWQILFIDNNEVSKGAVYVAATILESIKNQWENTPPSWTGSDPCGNNWEGIVCTDSRVTSMYELA